MQSRFEIENDELLLYLNPRVYNLERIYATAYIFIDRFYFIFDGDPNTEILIRAIPKKKTDLGAFAKLFFEELLSISNYFLMLEKNKDIVTAVLKRALFSITPTPLNQEQEESIKKLDKEIEELGKI